MIKEKPYSNIYEYIVNKKEIELERECSPFQSKTEKQHKLIEIL